MEQNSLTLPHHGPLFGRVEQLVPRPEALERNRQKMKLRELAMGEKAFVLRIAQERNVLEASLLRLCAPPNDEILRHDLEQILVIARGCGLETLERAVSGALITNDRGGESEKAATLARMQRLGSAAIFTLSCYLGA